MENPTKFTISLEHIDANESFHTFRVAFSECDSRILLPYPHVTGLRFVDQCDTEIAEWTSRSLGSSPLDDFVLTPDARISFDLHAHINTEPTQTTRWAIELPIAAVHVRFCFHVDDKRDWYDFLAKRSRFAGMTPPWNGTVESNTIEIVNNISGIARQTEEE